MRIPRVIDSVYSSEDPDEGSFVLVGGCYVDGIMYGEVFDREDHDVQGIALV